MLTALWNNRIEVVAVILFAVGFSTLLLHRNLLKKVIGLNIIKYKTPDSRCINYICPASLNSI